MASFGDDLGADQVELVIAFEERLDLERPDKHQRVAKLPRILAGPWVAYGQREGNTWQPLTRK
jgi:hypothetical protein